MSARGKKQTKAEEVEVDEESEQLNVKGGKSKNTRAKPAPKKTAAKTPSKGSKTTKKTTPARGKKTAGKQKGGNTQKPTERYFKLIDAKTGKSYGRYIGGTPKQAASKGYTKMLQKLKANGKKAPAHSVIYLRESTRGSARKVYGYEAARIRLPEPQELVITDKETGKEKTITYNFRNKIKKVAVPDNVMLGGGRSKSNMKKGTSKKTSGSKSTKKTPAKSTGKKPSPKATSAKSTPAKSTKKTSGSKTAKKPTAKNNNKKSTTARASSSR